ncbi:MAG: sigma-70 family RNA polymerase sigma factor [Acidimicrobiales bacterium]
MGRTRELEPTQRELVAQYEALRRFASVVADSDMDPDDVCQEAMTRVLLAVRGGRGPAPSEVGAYARRAIVSVCSNTRRGMARRSAAVRRAGRTSDEELPMYPSEVAVLDGIPARARAVLYLQHVEGRTSEEIGAWLGLTAEAVRATASRARRRLRVEADSAVAAQEEHR